MHLLEQLLQKPEKKIQNTLIEKTVIDYFKYSLNIEVYGEFPENPPETFLIVEKTGSRREEMIDFATIAIQSYAKSLYLAAELNLQVKSVMEDIVDLPSVSAADLNSDYNFTDLSMKRYRYQAVYEITHY